ncbi:PD40 domain-containing protein [candidate division KSB1 bacterium]|nr:PD40 domain-containing protein [candidate division KSB1 bacterium]
MRNNPLIYILISAALFSLSIFSCKDEHPTGNEFAWSPDGKTLALFNPNSNELALLAVEADKIASFAARDSLNFKPFESPDLAWSNDGKFVLYWRRNEKCIELCVTSISDCTTVTILRRGPGEKNNVMKVSPPCWSPKDHLILWTQSVNNRDMQIVIFSLETMKQQIVAELSCEMLLPAWHPDGQEIFYAVFVARQHPMNGLWKMDLSGDNKQQITHSETITQFEWAPDMKTIGLISIDSTAGTCELTQIDAAGKSECLLKIFDANIDAFDWSPDGASIAYWCKADSLSSIRLLDIESRNDVPITSGEVDNFYGWSPGGKVFYGIKLPEELIKLSKDKKDKLGFHYIIMGLHLGNAMISWSPSGISRLENNISCLKENYRTGAAAYFMAYLPDLFSKEVYCPIVRFPDGNFEIIARTADEYHAAADLLSKAKKYGQAYQAMNKYWDGNLEPEKFESYFDTKTVPLNTETNQDSIRSESLRMSLLNSALLKSIIILRRIEREKDANWLLEQYVELCRSHFDAKQKSKNDYDRVFWGMLRSYGIYRECAAGVEDIQKMMRSLTTDTTFTSYLLFGQALLAFEAGKNDVGLEALNNAIRIMPEDLAEGDDIIDMFSIYFENFSAKDEAAFDTFCWSFLTRNWGKQKPYELFTMLGDFYYKLGKPQNAIMAYQTAISKTAETQDLWEKIIHLELR